MASCDLVLFETCIRANRSLSRRGLRLVAALLVCPSLSIGALFAWLGAWPVPGFCGAEIGLALLLLSRTARAPRPWERIVLRADELLVSRGRGGRETELVRLVPFWTRIELVDRPAAPLRVQLVGGQESSGQESCGQESGVQGGGGHGSGGRDSGIRGREEVGALLGEAERRALALRLSAALRQCKGF